MQAAAKLRREREAAPLFAADIAAQQPSVDAILDANQAAFEEYQQERRNWVAMRWKQARRELRAMPRAAELYALWNEAPYPASPEYLLDMLHRLRQGHFTIEAPPWKFTPAEIAEGRARLEAYWTKQREARAGQ